MFHRAARRRTIYGANEKFLLTCICATLDFAFRKEVIIMAKKATKKKATKKKATKKKK